ncbi:MAG: glucokinase [Oligoflexus sp.]
MADFLIGDIGGTNARLALACRNTLAIRCAKTFGSQDFPSFRQVIETYLAELPAGELIPEHACFAVASPITGDMVHFTNNPWSFSISELARNLPFRDLKVINDFVAVAMSLPHLSADHLLAMGTGALDPSLTLGVLGPGTGLGMALLLDVEGRKIPMPTEGGHAAWCPSDEYEMELWKVLRQGREIVSREDLLSGQGLVNLANAVRCVDGWVDEGVVRAEEITRLAIGEANSQYIKVLDYFCAILGATAGDFALQTGARGGIFIAGGIIPRFREFFMGSRFREKFEAKGRFYDYVHEIPSVLITAGQPGLIGAAAALQN